MKSKILAITLLVFLSVLTLGIVPSARAEGGVPPDVAKDVSPDVPNEAVSPTGLWTESQVSFNPGSFNGRSAEFSSLKVQGYNQNNEYKTWYQTFSWRSTTYYINNWWWKPDRGIRFEFNLRWWTGSYWATGTRWCTITRTGWPQPSWINVKYVGNYQCTY